MVCAGAVGVGFAGGVGAGAVGAGFAGGVPCGGLAGVVGAWAFPCNHAHDDEAEQQRHPHDAHYLPFAAGIIPGVRQGYPVWD